MRFQYLKQRISVFLLLQLSTLRVISSHLFLILFEDVWDIPNWHRDLVRGARTYQLFYVVVG